MSTTHTEHDVEIFARLLQPENGNLHEDAARFFLSVEFAVDDQARMHELAGKAQQGTLTADEKQEADSYAFVGNVLGILKSKARRSLKQAAGES